MSTEFACPQADATGHNQGPPVRNAKGWKSRESLFVLPSLIFLALIYAYPLCQIVVWSIYDPGLTAKNYVLMFARPAYLKALWNTIEVSAFVTLVCLILGYPLAYLLSLLSGFARGILFVAVVLPFTTSILVRSFAWVIILGENGLINKGLALLGLVDHPVKLIYNMVGVLIALAHILLPFMILPLYGVMTRIDRSLIRAARSLGASPSRAFFKVFVPLSLPGVVSGSCLVFLLAAGSYITPALVGGRGQITLTMLMDISVNELLDWGFGSALGVLLLAVVGGIYVLATSFLGIRVISEGGAR